MYASADLELTIRTWIWAALLLLPADAAASHTTALWLHGVEVGRAWPLHFSTNTARKSERARIVVHRRKGLLHPRSVQGIRSLGPDRSFVDAATVLGFIQLVQAGDWLLRLGCTTYSELHDYAMRSHLDGVLRARRALQYVCTGVESPRETLVRLMLVFARLPKPQCNVNIFDGPRFVARVDMMYAAYKVIVEYDGWQHERDAAQRQRDRVRLEELHALGWTVIVVTAADLEHRREVVRRVHRALVANGYRGGEPVFNAMWPRFFG